MHAGTNGALVNYLCPRKLPYLTSTSTSDAEKEGAARGGGYEDARRRRGRSAEDMSTSYPASISKDDPKVSNVYSRTIGALQVGQCVGREYT